MLWLQHPWYVCHGHDDGGSEMDADAERGERGYHLLVNFNGHLSEQSVFKCFLLYPLRPPGYDVIMGDDDDRSHHHVDGVLLSAVVTATSCMGPSWTSE